MANYGGLGRGQAYQGIIAAGQRYFVMTQDAYDPVAQAPMRSVAPSPIPVVFGGLALNTQNETNTGMYGKSAFDPRTSLLPWLLVGLFVGLVWIHVIHFS